MMVRGRGEIRRNIQNPGWEVSTVQGTQHILDLGWHWLFLRTGGGHHLHLTQDGNQRYEGQEVYPVNIANRGLAETQSLDRLTPKPSLCRHPKWFLWGTVWFGKGSPHHFVLEFVAWIEPKLEGFNGTISLGKAPEAQLVCGWRGGCPFCHHRAPERTIICVGHGAFLSQPEVLTFHLQVICSEFYLFCQFT